MTLLRDFEHAYRDWKGAEGVCRVRIFAPTAASGGLEVAMSVSNGGRTPKTGGRALDGRTWDQFPVMPALGVTTA